MHPYYDYDYCCKRLEKVGRDIRDQINKELPLAITDTSIPSVLLSFEIMECPFCKESIEKLYEAMRLEWNDRHPTTNLHFNVGIEKE